MGPPQDEVAAVAVAVAVAAAAAAVAAAAVAVVVDRYGSCSRKKYNKYNDNITTATTTKQHC